MERYSQQVLFTYNTLHLKIKDKVRFYYALKGRDGKSGIIKRFNIEQLGRTVLLVEKKFEKDIDLFFKVWKCKYKKKKLLVENG